MAENPIGRLANAGHDDLVRRQIAHVLLAVAGSDIDTSSTDGSRELHVVRMVSDCE